MCALPFFGWMMKNKRNDKLEDCMGCPLPVEKRKDCGKDYTANFNSGVRFGRKPDARCKLLRG